MAGAERPSAFRDSVLFLRIVVGAALGGVAVLLVLRGGVPFAAFAALSSFLIFTEWGALHDFHPYWARMMGIVLALMAFLAIADARAALFFLAVLAAAVFALATMQGSARRWWIAAGVPYAGLPAVALVSLRGEHLGLFLTFWTLGIVWATDICAYAAGRLFGRRRIWPALSPNKTWEGLLGGIGGAALFSALVAARWFPHASLPLLVVLAAVLAVVAQAGDFFESFLKRRAGVKDSGQLLPGHGGAMDRLDGLVPVACAVALSVALLRRAGA